MSDGPTKVKKTTRSLFWPLLPSGGKISSNSNAEKYISLCTWGAIIVLVWSCALEQQSKIVNGLLSVIMH